MGLHVHVAVNMLEWLSFGTTLDICTAVLLVLLLLLLLFLLLLFLLLLLLLLSLSVPRVLA